MLFGLEMEINFIKFSCTENLKLTKFSRIENSCKCKGNSSGKIGRRRVEIGLVQRKWEKGRGL